MKKQKKSDKYQRPIFTTFYLYLFMVILFLTTQRQISNQRLEE
jgi:hypothetical protein